MGELTSSFSSKFIDFRPKHLCRLFFFINLYFITLQNHLSKGINRGT